MKSAIVIGAGARGTRYSEMMKSLGTDMKVIAVAEPIENRRDYLGDMFDVPDQMRHKSWEELLSMPKFADFVIIATQDRDHIAPAMAAIEKGYDLLLEKPMGATAEECVRIARAAEERGVLVLVCHVLRFTKFFRGLKSIIKSGRIGEVVHIQHAECVGNLHQSHSFVRGNWKNSDESAPMILAKSCHDMDILSYLIGRECKRVHSFGSLTYFRSENAPSDAPDFCIDGCPHKDECFYYAPRLYLQQFDRGGFPEAVTKTKRPSDEELIIALKNTDYGRCVFKCPNNVVDHQTVNLEYDGGATASFTMCAFNKGSRNIRIMGTRGEIIANMGDPFYTVFDFDKREYVRLDIDDAVTNEGIDGGHGGGDGGIVRALQARLGGDFSDESICSIWQTCRSHLIAFAAEESRLLGTVVDLGEFEGRF